MFDMGFIADLRFLLRRLPPYNKRQSMLFSATLSYEVMELAYEHMNDPIKVVGDPGAADGRERRAPALPRRPAREAAAAARPPAARAADARRMVFVNTKRAGEWLAERLDDNGIMAQAITGDLDQRVRLRLVRDFKSGDLPILIATDVASRGLHIDDVSHVINYDLPQDAENYVHRVGRTARAGASGKAISLACEEYVESLEGIEQLTGFKIPVEHVTDEMLVHPQPPRHGAPSQPAAAVAGHAGRARPQRGGAPARAARRAAATPATPRDAEADTAA